MFSRIRIYALIITVEVLVFLAFWAWWAFPEIVRFETFRDLGVIELLQTLLLAGIGLSACLLCRYRHSAVDHPLFDFSFCQFIGAACFFLTFRESDYFLTFFMKESQFEFLWMMIFAIVAIYGLRHFKRITAGVREMFSTRSIWFFMIGFTLYLVLAQIVGTKQFRHFFYPNTNNFIRRYTEESMELIGLLIIGFGMLELHLQVRQLLSGRWGEQTKDWTEEVWRSFAQMPYEFTGGMPFKKTQGAKGEIQMTMEQQILSRRPGEAGPPTAVLPERMSRQLEELVFVSNKLRRSNTNFSATILFIGASLVIALLWFGFVFRQNAIEHSTNFQMELLGRHYELQVEQYQAQPKKWKRKNPLPDFRYEQLRTAIRNDVAQEYNFANFFKRNVHRSLS